MKLSIPFAQRTFDIYLDTQGDRGEPVLMVHGIPTNARLWRHVQALLKNRYRTFAMDMVGYGESDMPLNDFNHSLGNQAEVLKGVIESLGLKGQAILCAHDHGGGVAQILASKHPDHIRRLVLINPVSFDYWPVCEVEALAALDGAPDEILRGAMAQAMANFPSLLRMGSYDGTPFYDQNVKQNYLRFWGRGPDLTGFKSLIRVSKDPTNSETMEVDHTKITCPTLIIWALNDVFMPREAARRLKEAIKGPVRLEYIERAGHWVQEDRPNIVADTIDDFITEWADVQL